LAIFSGAEMWQAETISVALLYTPLIAETHVPDKVYEQARQHFSEQELVDLTLAVVAINGWNRIAISFRLEPGTYQPAPSRKPPEEH